MYWKSKGFIISTDQSHIQEYHYRKFRLSLLASSWAREFHHFRGTISGNKETKWRGNDNLYKLRFVHF